MFFHMSSCSPRTGKVLFCLRAAPLSLHRRYCRRAAGAARPGPRALKQVCARSRGIHPKVGRRASSIKGRECRIA